MHYADLIENVSKHGYGVFTITMLSDPKERNTFKNFIHYHPSFFFEVKRKSGDIKICKLTPVGKKYFGVNYRESNSQMWQSLMDVALFNAYMCEKGHWVKISNKPHFVTSINHQKVGLISSRWGINKGQCDLLLSTQLQKKSLLNDEDYLVKTSKALKISVEELMLKISSAHVPNAFIHLRND